MESAYVYECCRIVLDVSGVSEGSPSQTINAKLTYFLYTTREKIRGLCYCSLLCSSGVRWLLWQVLLVKTVDLLY